MYLNANAMCWSIKHTDNVICARGVLIISYVNHPTEIEREYQPQRFAARISRQSKLQRSLSHEHCKVALPPHLIPKFPSFPLSRPWTFREGNVYRTHLSIIIAQFCQNFRLFQGEKKERKVACASLSFHVSETREINVTPAHNSLGWGNWRQPLQHNSPERKGLAWNTDLACRIEP